MSELYSAQFSPAINCRVRKPTKSHSEPNLKIPSELTNPGQLFASYGIDLSPFNGPHFQRENLVVSPPKEGIQCREELSAAAKPGREVGAACYRMIGRMVGWASGFPPTRSVSGRIWADASAGRTTRGRRES